MKLIICSECWSVTSLSLNKPKSCDCGKSGGQYVDTLNAEIWGEAIPIGFSNNSLLGTVKLQRLLDRMEKNPNVCCKGEEFTAFTIPKWADSIKRVEKDLTKL
jgi:hypothetical protein